MQADFPTRVGMARINPVMNAERFGFPHPRGDGPQRRWRCLAISRDFPTRVGMARDGAGNYSFYYGFPHPRGDGPLLKRRTTQQP